MNSTSKTEYRVKSERGTSPVVSLKTVIAVLKIARKCNTMNDYIIIEDGVEVPANSWIRRKANNGK